MARGSRRRTSQRRPRGVKTATASWFKGTAGRARLTFLGAIVASAVVLFAWFPAGSLISQRSDLHGTEAELNALHAQDSALAQESKNLSDAGEIERIAREQYQLVSPGQQSYEVLPPSGAAAAGTPYAGDPGSDGPVTPSATPELPPGSVTTTTTPTATKPASSGERTDDTHPDAPSTPSGGFGSRVLHSLEFWR
jgi:cell division protein FtsB